MTSSTQQFCGNCKSPVDPSEVVCPTCGVLLAAYASIAGASAPESLAPDPVTTAAPPPMNPAPIAPPPLPTEPIAQPSLETTAETATPPTVPEPPATVAPPVHRPSSQSPIGDALKRSHQQSQRDLGYLGTEPDALTRMVHDAANLTDMADGDDELADMADGHDDLATMASGKDELAEMAAGPSGTTLAEEVEAELRDAAIATHHGEPVIEESGGGSVPLNADPVAVEEAAAVVLERPTDPRASVQRSEPTTPEPQPVVAAPAPSRPAPSQRGGREQPIAWVDSDSRARNRSTSAPSEPPISTIKPKDLVLWIPFGLMICVVLGIGGRADGFVGFLLFAVVIVTFGFLLKTTRATSRKTTTMPKQKPGNRRR